MVKISELDRKSRISFSYDNDIKSKSTLSFINGDLAFVIAHQNLDYLKRQSQKYVEINS